MLHFNQNLITSLKEINWKNEVMRLKYIIIPATEVVL